MKGLYRAVGGRKAFQALLAAFLEVVTYVLVAWQVRAEPALLVELTKLFWGAIGGTLVTAAWAIAWEDRSNLSTILQRVRGGSPSPRGHDQAEPGEQ